LAWLVGMTGFALALHLYWPSPPGVAVEGAVIGCLTALSAFGIGLVFRANRVVNFAQADLGVLPSAVFIVLFTVRLWSYWASLALAVGAAIVLGFLVERVVVRWFAKSPRLLLLVATIGLSRLLAGAGSAVPSYNKVFTQIPGSNTTRPIIRGASKLAPQPFAPPFHVKLRINPFTFGGNEVIAVGTVAIVVVLLVVFLRRTRMGLALRASAENIDRALLLGIPVPRVQNVAWVIATVLSTLSLVLRAGVFGLPSTTLFGPGFLLRTLAVALMGRMEHFGVMLMAGIGLGIVEETMLWQWKSAALLDVSLALVIVVVLLVQRSRSTSPDDPGSSWRSAPLFRGATKALTPLRRVRWSSRIMVVVGTLLLAFLPIVLDPARLFLATLTIILMMVALSLVILTGWAGEIILGQMAFVGAGTAAGAVLSFQHRVEPVVSILGAGVLAALAAAVIGVVAVRIRGQLLAIVTFAVAVGASSYLLDPDAFHLLPHFDLMRIRPRAPVLAVFPIAGDVAFYYFCAAVLGVALWWTLGLRRFRMARVLVAIRENPRAAHAFGIDVAQVRVLAFAVSGFFAGVAGGLIALQQQDLPLSLFRPEESIRALAGAVIGGLNSLGGSMVGTLFLRSTEWFASSTGRYRPVLAAAGTGGGLLLIVMLAPGGFASVVDRMRRAALRTPTSRRGLVDAGLQAWARVKQATRGAWRLGARPRPPVRGELRLRSLRAGYGGNDIVRDVNLEVASGEVVAILGGNGAGKSTLFRAVSGLIPSRGTVEFAGVDLGRLAAHQISRLGVIQVPSAGAVFESMTVAENLSLASWLGHRDRTSMRAQTEHALEEFPVLRDRLHQPSRTLSGGQRQLLSFAMALVARPRVLMIDELSVGLAPAVVDGLVDIVRQLLEDGTAVLLVEHSVDVASRIAKVAYVLDRGSVGFHGLINDFVQHEAAGRSLFLNAAGAAAGEKGPGRRLSGPTTADTRRKPIVLRASHLSKAFSGEAAVKDLSMSVHRGEIVGVIGPNGAGKTTLVDLVSGFVLPDAGRVFLGDLDISRQSPSARARRGLARSFQDGSLFGALTVHETVTMSLGRQDRIDPVADALHLPGARRRQRSQAESADRLVDSLGLTAYRDVLVSELSTGVRRLVDLACQLGCRPRVIILDEPSAGMAEQETAALAPLLLRVRRQTQAGLLLVEHDMTLIAAVADRVVALDSGRCIASGPPEEVLEDERVVTAYFGPRAAKT
jgi:ABC-type branched-subunit amino acid transport system ATPase component/branched-subunit amino acid ABC-type transport system permease component